MVERVEKVLDQRVRREYPDAAAAAILGLLPETIDYLNAGASAYRPPTWVAEFQNNPREIRIRAHAGRR